MQSFISSKRVTLRLPGRPFFLDPPVCQLLGWGLPPASAPKAEVIQRAFRAFRARIEVTRRRQIREGTRPGAPTSPIVASRPTGPQALLFPAVAAMFLADNSPSFCPKGPSRSF